MRALLTYPPSPHQENTDVCPIPFPKGTLRRQKGSLWPPCSVGTWLKGVTEAECAHSERNRLGESEISQLFPLPEPAAGQSCFSVKKSRDGYGDLLRARNFLPSQMSCSRQQWWQRVPGRAQGPCGGAVSRCRVLAPCA